MNRLIEIAAMALGALSLFSICFLGFTTLSGVPLHKVAVIGQLFPQPEEPDSTEPAGLEDESSVPPPRPSETVLKSNLGMLGVWSLPSPFSQDELQELSDDLKSRTFELDQRERTIEERERRIDDELGGLAERFRTLDELRESLERFESELELRALEVQRDEGAAAGREAQRWAQVALIFDSVEGQEAAEILAEYTPEEAASILKQLDPGTASSLLTSLRSIPSVAPEWRAYVDAYSASGSTGATRR